MQYCKKPVVIEATQWWKNGDHAAVAPYRGDRWSAAVHGSGAKGCEQDALHWADHGWIETLEGGHIVCPGDFIITGVAGEVYPCKPAIFRATYDPVTDEGTPIGEVSDLLYAAHETLGIYPQVRIFSDGTRTESTPWEEGWNAALIGLFERYHCLLLWIDTLPVAVVEAVRFLLAEDVLIIRINKDNAIWCQIYMNDTFDYATAEAEEVTPDQLPELAHLYRTYGYSGLVAWVSLRRNLLPLRERQTESYHAARALLTSQTHETHDRP